MKLIDVEARNAKELASLQRKIAAFIKKAGCSTGEIRWSKNGFTHWVEVDNDGRLGDYLYDIIKKSAFAVQIEVEEFDGNYMWSADHYVRPCSAVSFVF